MSPLAYPEYPHISRARIDKDGNLRLFRPRRWGWMPARQDVFHPSGEWLNVLWHPSGKLQVTVKGAKP
jgi:hypothetical protein